MTRASGHSALVRGEDGGLQVRRFATAADASAAAQPRELPLHQQIAAVMAQGRGEIRSPQMARRLGVHPRTIRRAFERGWLPGAKEHGPQLLVVPVGLLRLAEAYGLRQVGRFAEAGLIRMGGTRR